MGKAKGELDIGGGPILAYLLDRFGWPGPTLLVTAPGREKPPGWGLFSREVTDPVAGEGPLRGVLTALEESETQFTLVTTVDMPEVGFEQLAWLVGALEGRPEARGILLERPGEPRRIEPFPSVFHRDAAGLIRSRLAAGLGSVQLLRNAAEISVVPSPREWPDCVWTNLNRPKDLNAWLGT
jgi:molybdopterin-guanine dinucleotide biosynthesis protein A